MKTKILLPKDAKEKSLIEGKVGLWIDGKVYWFNELCEKLIPEKRLSIHIKKAVHHSKIKLLEVFVKNHSTVKRNCKLLFMNYIPHEHFCFISPADDVIFHFVKDHVYLVNGYCNGKRMCGATVQPFWNVHTDVIWSSLSQGVLKYQPMTKGMVVSIFSLEMSILENKSALGYSWTIQGKERDETISLNEMFMKNVLAISHKK